MPRKHVTRARRNSESEEDFQTPSPPPDATNYSFEYTNRSPTRNRIVNPNQPSTSAAARQKYYARKSTGAAPHGRNAPIREHLSHSRNTEESSPERRSTRNVSRSETAAAPQTKSTNMELQRIRDKDPQRAVVKHRRKQEKPISQRNRMMKEIRRLQNYDGFLIPRAPFGRLLREVMREASSEVTMITKTALEGIQEACEIYLVQVLTDAYALTLHRGRVTLMPKDIQLLRVIRLID